MNEKGNDPKANAASRLACWQVLRAVWQHRELAAASPDLFGERLRDSVPDLPCVGGLARWVKKAEGDEGLRRLWEALSTLSFEEAHDVQQALSERARQEERAQAVAFRSQRVNRLKGLGNAVVPQVAEWIGRRLIEATHTGG